jgi:hypothetical protein
LFGGVIVFPSPESFQEGIASKMVTATIGTSPPRIHLPRVTAATDGGHISLMRGSISSDWSFGHESLWQPLLFAQSLATYFNSSILRS